MSLARGERPIRVVPEHDPATPSTSAAMPAGDVRPVDSTLVIAVAPTAADRIRIVDAVGDSAPVLLVGSLREAMTLVAGAVAEVSSVPDPRHHEVAGVISSDLTTDLTSDIAELADLTELSPGDDDAADDLTIDSDARVAVSGDRQTDLSPLEHDLLLSLYDAAGHIRTFEWLQRHVWHNDHQGGRSHVQSVVKRLRRKLRSISSPLQIDAVRGVGLRLVNASGSVHVAPCPACDAGT